MTPPRRRPRTWGIELLPIPPGGIHPKEIRLTVIDRETGQRVGSRKLPWSEFRDVARSVVLVNVDEGVAE